MSQYGAPPIGNNLRMWAERFTSYMMRTRSFLTHTRDFESAAEDGVILWDREEAYPVVSHSGAFYEITVKRAAPSSSVGSAGDTDGMVSWDGSYIYVCTADYDGTADIWKRVALTGGSW